VMRIYKKNELVGYILVNNESGGIRQETVCMRLFNPLKQSGKYIYIYNSASKLKKKYIFFFPARVSIWVPNLFFQIKERTHYRFFDI